MQIEKSENFNVIEAAEYLRISKATLDRMRLNGNGPPYAQVQFRARIIYRRCDLDKWLAAQIIHSTSEATS